MNQKTLVTERVMYLCRLVISECEDGYLVT